MKTFILLSLCALTLAGCYRMPGDEDFSVIPTTNNPSVTRDRSDSSLVPNMSY